jgi:hypothetical protein
MTDCIIHYSATNQMPDPKWRDRRGVVVARSRGRGPRNVLVETDIGRVVVPRWNVRPVKEFCGAFVVGVAFWLVAFWPWVERAVRG